MLVKRKRPDFSQSDSDPLSGMANLFDAAMVFAVALLVAMVTHFKMTEVFSEEDFTMVKNPGTVNMEIIQKKDGKIEKYTGSSTAGKGKGKRVGIAYEMDDGQIIYIPE